MSPAENHFDRLGLPRRFDLDPAEIERNYLARSRALHPDFHTAASSSEQRASMELTAALNDAYATLKHPFRRAEYLLALEGGPTASEHREMDPAFLEEMLELRMEIEESRGSGPESPALKAMEAQLNRRREGLIEQIGRAFGTLGTARASALIRVRQLLNAAKYVEGLLRDLRAD